MKKINEGSYGCIYYPSLTCNLKKSKKKNLISKIQINNKNSRNELEISKILKKKYIKGLRGVKSSCIIKKNNIIKKVKDCSIITEDTDLNILKMDLEYIEGYELNKYINKKNLINSYKICLNNLKKLNNLDICHFDIKNNNIMYSKTKKYLYIIDFGLSINIKKLKENKFEDYFFTYETYQPWCIDIIFLNYVINKRKIINNKQELEEIVKTYMDTIFFNKCSKKFKNIYKKECIKYLTKYINKSIPYIKRNIIKNWKTWDIYSLSIIFIKLYKLHNYQDNSFIELLFQSIHPNPDKRLNYNEILKTIDEIKKYNKTNKRV